MPSGAEPTAVAPVIPIHNAQSALARRRLQLETLGLPLPHVPLLLDPSRIDADTITMRAAARYLRERTERPWLLFCGNKGVGKTFAAGWIAASLLDATPAGTVEWTTGIEVAREEPWSENITSLSRARILVVDDVGAGFIDRSGMFVSKVEVIVCPRYDRLRPLVVTTNLSWEEFCSHYPRVADRFVEIGRTVRDGGPSLRGKKP